MLWRIELKKRLNKFIDVLRGNILQIMEISVLAFVIFIPQFIDLKKFATEYSVGASLNTENFLWYIAVSSGNIIASIALFLLALLGIRLANKNFLMNRIRGIYHDYAYIWYWICAKVLGIKKCSLVLVPIYMQFKLVIHGTFENYPLNSEEYPTLDGEVIDVEERNNDVQGYCVNLMLEDTYPIDYAQLPEELRGLRTIKISRNTGDKCRYFSQALIKKTINVIRALNDNTVINLYATTNPMNTLHLAQEAFSLGYRGNIEHLYVFQQSKDNGRMFFPKGCKVF